MQIDSGYAGRLKIEEIPPMTNNFMRNFIEKHMKDKLNGKDIDKYIYYFDGNMNELVNDFKKSQLTLDGMFKFSYFFLIQN